MNKIAMWKKGVKHLLNKPCNPACKVCVHNACAHARDAPPRWIVSIRDAGS